MAFSTVVGGPEKNAGHPCVQEIRQAGRAVLGLFLNFLVYVIIKYDIGWEHETKE
jgi:hypothetical protein